jgi:hypothetical protein
MNAGERFDEFQSLDMTFGMAEALVSHPPLFADCGATWPQGSGSIDSSANPHLSNDLGTIIAFTGKTYGLTRLIGRRGSQ